ncbi:hypothetical protein ACIRYZ_17560 [Kitasatospora sp. NPDC101155]|uniref:hypothetical protein n=1 Tax=Kitasatospora sp. NPDC101155 TaxID=3364097 RepID=UPI00382E1008
MSRPITRPSTATNPFSRERNSAANGEFRLAAVSASTAIAEPKANTPHSTMHGARRGVRATKMKPWSRISSPAELYSASKVAHEH